MNGNQESADLEKQITTPNDLPPPAATTSKIERDDDDESFPEGGLKAWSVVLGAFCGMLAALGTMNSIGIYQAYLIENQLQGYSESTIGWIFGLYTFLSFFCGVQVGPIFDVYGPRILVATGSVLLLLSTFLLSVCTLYWHFLIVFGLIGGMGTSLIFTPSISAVGHWFNKRRGYATGCASTAGGMGGIILPLMLQRLFVTVGFATATRIVGAMYAVLLIIANILLRSRLPPRPGGSVIPSARVFVGAPAFSLTTAGTFFQEWGLFTPIAFLTSYGIHSGAMSAERAYQLIAVFNAGSVLGRWLPGLLADRWGRYNAMLTTLAICCIAATGFWLPAALLTSQGIRDPVTIGGLIWTFAAIMGFASGSNLSLTPVCVGQLCPTRDYGRYYASCYTIVSFATLTGLPIAGSLIAACGGEYWGLVTFTGLCYAISFALFAAARVIMVGWSPRVVY